MLVVVVGGVIVGRINIIYNRRQITVKKTLIILILVEINLSLSEILLTNYYFSLRYISLKNSEILCEHYVVREIAFINNLLLEENHFLYVRTFKIVRTRYSYIDTLPIN